MTKRSRKFFSPTGMRVRKQPVLCARLQNKSFLQVCKKKPHKHIQNTHKTSTEQPSSAQTQGLEPRGCDPGPPYFLFGKEKVLGFFFNFLEPQSVLFSHNSTISLAATLA